MRTITLHNAVLEVNGVDVGIVGEVELTVEDPKVWDVIPPFGWNWTAEDWHMQKFVRGLCAKGGVVRGELFDYYVLIEYNKDRPSKSLIITERTRRI